MFAWLVGLMAVQYVYIEFVLTIAYNIACVACVLVMFYHKMLYKLIFVHGLELTLEFLVGKNYFAFSLGVIPFEPLDQNDYSNKRQKFIKGPFIPK